MEILSTGHQLWRAEAFDAEVRRLGATVVDIRYHPWSKDPDWRSETLARRLGAAYWSVTALGNVNHRTDGTVQIKDLEAGIAAVLRCRGPVILLCACWDAGTCHRKRVAAQFEQRGLKVREMETPRRDHAAPGQLELFEEKDGKGKESRLD